MTVPASARRAGPYNGNDATTAFGFTFKVFDEADLRVVENTDGAETDALLNSDYTVSLNADQDATPGGTVTYASAPASGTSITIVGDLDYDQPTQLPDGGAYRASTNMNALDRLAMLIQQIRELFNRALKFPVSDADDLVTELPTAVLRADTLLGFDDDGAIEVVPRSTLTALVTAASTSATSAEASRDAIDNRIYPDTYASNPITRPDGSAVQAGDMAFYTDNLWRRYNGSTWVASDLTSADVADLIGNHRIQATALAGLADNIIHGHSTNAVAADVSAASISGGGQTGYNNVIGGDGSATVNTATPNATSAGTGADYSTVFAGYDNVVGGLAGMIGGYHCYIGLGATHGTIVGGSVHAIKAGDYNGIVAGQQNTIEGGTDYGTIVGGGGGSINMAAGQDYGTVVGGFSGSVTARYGTTLGGNNPTASGIGAVALGGQNSTASGNQSLAAGDTNTAGGIGSVVLGGENNTASATASRSDYSAILASFQSSIGTTAAARFSGILAGRANTVNAEYGATVGGRECSVASLAEAGVASGYGAKATIAGEHVQASGYFAAAGDAQASVLVARRQTTDATPIELRVGSTLGARMLIPTDTTWAFSIVVVARRTDANDESAAYKLEGCIDRNSGSTTAIVGTVTKTVLGEDTAAWDVAAVADTINNALQINVTGEAAKTINWVARVTLVEVTG